MRLGIKIKQACFSTFYFHYICGQLVLYFGKSGYTRRSKQLLIYKCKT